MINYNRDLYICKSKNERGRGSGSYIRIWCIRANISTTTTVLIFISCIIVLQIQICTIDIVVLLVRVKMNWYILWIHSSQIRLDDIMSSNYWNCCFPRLEAYEVWHNYRTNYSRNSLWRLKLQFLVSIRAYEVCRLEAYEVSH